MKRQRRPSKEPLVAEALLGLLDVPAKKSRARRACVDELKNKTLVRGASKATSALASNAYCRCRKTRDEKACIAQIRAKFSTAKRRSTLGGLRKPKN